MFEFSSRCIVKITGDMTVSFPSGIIKVFTSNPSPAVLCFRVKNTSKLEQILPNAQLVYRFWFIILFNVTVNYVIVAYINENSLQSCSFAYS